MFLFSPSHKSERIRAVVHSMAFFASCFFPYSIRIFFLILNELILLIGTQWCEEFPEMYAVRFTYALDESEENKSGATCI